MPKGPRGVKRPADVVANAVHIMKIATGEIEDKPSKTPNRAKGGKIGGQHRAAALPGGKRAEIAKKAAESRWRRKSSPSG